MFHIMMLPLHLHVDVKHTLECSSEIYRVGVSNSCDCLDDNHNSSQVKRVVGLIGRPDGC